jgi:ubiquinone/menaquinone biosynthesis C-methylase UbiE/DNA-binding transcriptional ArsR family regulator
MPSIVKTLRVLADPHRLRLLLLLEQEELSVAELQDIMALGQSTISTHLSQLKQAGLVEDRRTGKNNLYRLKQDRDTKVLRHLLEQASEEIPETLQDREGLGLILRRRQDKMRGFFDEMAGRFGRTYVPGRSWEGMAQALLKLMPPMVIADLGAGEGTFSLLLAQRAKQVIAIDNSDKMVEFGTNNARQLGVENIEYRKGDLEQVPIEDSSVDIVFFSQALHHALHPERAIAEARRILKPGGRVAILDLLKHRFEEARQLYADLWLGFSEAEAESILKKTGFRNVQTSIVHRETEAPHFQTLLAVGDKEEESH